MWSSKIDNKNGKKHCIICGTNKGSLYRGEIKEISVILCEKHKLSCDGCVKVHCIKCGKRM